MWIDYLKWLWILYIEEQSMDSRQVPISQPASCRLLGWLGPQQQCWWFCIHVFCVGTSCVDTVRSVRQVLITAMYCRLLGCPSVPNLVLVILPYLFAQHVGPRPELDAVVGQASPHHSQSWLLGWQSPQHACWWCSILLYVIIRILFEFELIVN